jgi:hypothetical protein
VLLPEHLQAMPVSQPQPPAAELAQPSAPSCCRPGRKKKRALHEVLEEDIEGAALAGGLAAAAAAATAAGGAAAAAAQGKLTAFIHDPGAYFMQQH